MASIYDIARIASGDPMGRVSDRAKEADVLFNQYQRQKEIVDEINEAIAEAKRKQKKNKFGYGLAGSLLGVAGSALFPGAGPVVQGLLGGLGSGVAEKFRQDRSDATDKLKEIEKKYKGRKEAKLATEAREVFEAEQDAMLQTDVISGALANLIAPVSPQSKAATTAAPAQFMDADTFLASPGVSVFNPAEIGINKEMAEAILGIPQEALEGLDNNILTGLLRALGPQVYGQIATPKAIVDPLYAPQFRNPYGGF